jgi:hypothetical protein
VSGRKDKGSEIFGNGITGSFEAKRRGFETEKELKKLSKSSQKVQKRSFACEEDILRKIDKL